MGSRWKIKTSRQRHGDVFLKSNFHKRKYSPVVVVFGVSKSSTYSTNIHQSLPRRNHKKRILIFHATENKGIPGGAAEHWSLLLSLRFYLEETANPPTNQKKKRTNYSKQLSFFFVVSIFFIFVFNFN